ncbi:Hypothetical protein LUCI_3399 [Lucifera butyrica]|uniref:Uncharacterized protein n=2 Tax=Lucifera butyrica TaxID=1351585 RepID=A0A498R9C7_9FIRM|nr:Hypothetical protein LUCI_3399 [Lucifera butyrica]
MINTTVSAAVNNRDVIEAEYAAEGGAKRAIVEFNQTGTDWTWLNKDQQFDTDFPTNQKKYNVIIYKSADASKTPVTPVFNANNTYVIQSVGTVGKAKKTVLVTVNVTTGGGGAGGITNYLMYSGGNISLSGSYTQHGNIAAKGSIDTNGSLAPDNNSTLLPNQNDISWLSDFPVLTSTIDSDRPKTTVNPDKKGNYTLSGNYNNQTIVVNGDVTIAANTNFSNTSIYADGTIDLQGGGINFNNNCYLVANGDITMNGSVNLGGAVFVSYGSIDWYGSGTLNSGAIYAQKDITLHGSYTLTYSETTIKNTIGAGGGAGEPPIIGPWSSQ